MKLIRHCNQGFLKNLIIKIFNQWKQRIHKSMKNKVLWSFYINSIYQDWLSKQRLRKRENHTKFVMVQSEDLHRVVLRHLRTSTNREPSTNTIHKQFSKILLFPWTLQEKDQELKPYRLTQTLDNPNQGQKLERIWN